MRTLRVIVITFTGVVLVALALFYGFLSSEGLSSRKKPSNFEYTIANYALGLSIPSKAKKLTSPVSSNPEVLMDAKKSYSDNCAVCHGIDGTGKTKIADGLSPEVPDLHAKHIQKLTDGEMFYIYHQERRAFHRDARLGLPRPANLEFGFPSTTICQG
jgi:Cytochrome c